MENLDKNKVEMILKKKALKKDIIAVMELINEVPTFVEKPEIFEYKFNGENKKVKIGAGYNFKSAFDDVDDIILTDEIDPSPKFFYSNDGEDIEPYEYLDIDELYKHILEGFFEKYEEGNLEIILDQFKFRYIKTNKFKHLNNIGVNSKDYLEVKLDVEEDNAISEQYVNLDAEEWIINADDIINRFWENDL